ncbi:hypothetical protein [Mycolicibacterium conceptionense]|uniref:Uncharacterized protein n=1 Tax=Mycolicibacterium conceptionense TaxID=451644 RepID=A0A1A1YET4_9MYCO|nr:hypothetical protein [Mycolicibacterium conceptionense]OBF29819.1 hypothetical protein A5726_29925 [Mycolicibacterium conceptionense]OBF43747.1 hypothetical protein A5720_12055 [Mycolicibacterium conceptionense]OBH99355.1 hypothetical protein A5716_00245 [Mycolicibacterium conceptionense]
MSNLETKAVVARRFCWGWLIGSAVVSVLGVVTHAVLGSARSPLIASVLAFVIVMIQLAATYAVHVLVQAGLVGSAYLWARGGAVAIAFGAFVVNFVAQLGLVITWAGISVIIAWIVPLIIDLGMTVSTVALLALANAQRAAQLHTVVHHDAQATAAVHVEVHNTVHTETHTAHGDAQPAHDAARLEIAQRIAAKAGVRIEIERVAQVLTVYAQTGGTPSVIGRETGVHHKTVEKILAAV